MTSTTFFFVFIPILAVILLAVNLIFAPHNPYNEKNSTFECGFHSFLGQNRTQFSISFFIFALLFLLFDLEILLAYPYVVSAYTNAIYGLVIFLIFMLALTLGFVFELGKNALKIDSRQMFTLVSAGNNSSIINSASFLYTPLFSLILKNIYKGGHYFFSTLSFSTLINRFYYSVKLRIFFLALTWLLLFSNIETQSQSYIAAFVYIIYFGYSLRNLKWNVNNIVMALTCVLLNILIISIICYTLYSFIEYTNLYDFGLGCVHLFLYTNIFILFDDGFCNMSPHDNYNGESSNTGNKGESSNTGNNGSNNSKPNNEPNDPKPNNDPKDPKPNNDPLFYHDDINEDEDDKKGKKKAVDNKDESEAGNKDESEAGNPSPEHTPSEEAAILDYWRRQHIESLRFEARLALFKEDVLKDAEGGDYCLEFEKSLTREKLIEMMEEERAQERERTQEAMRTRADALFRAERQAALRAQAENALNDNNENDESKVSNKRKLEDSESPDNNNNGESADSIPSKKREL